MQSTQNQPAMGKRKRKKGTLINWKLLYKQAPSNLQIATYNAVPVEAIKQGARYS